ncbi:COA4 factor, partial [Atlantisia rogersi]|nr:COA4 factor [Atlantisia rogersi]
MARAGHARNPPSLRKAEAEEAEEEDPVDAMISCTGCATQHQELQAFMAARQDWRQCQPQGRAFGQCMARWQRDTQP